MWGIIATWRMAKEGIEKAEKWDMVDYLMKPWK